MELVVVFRTFDLAEAEVVKGRLEGAGFEAALQHENSAANFDVAGGGGRVVVPDAQAAEARALIQSSAPNPENNE